jgi:hypothetical protein
MPTKLELFAETHAKKGRKVIPARLQTALALLERLREFPSLILSEHHAPGSSGVRSHETYGKRAHNRLGLEPLNKNHGRRSSHLHEWGQDLLDAIAAAGFATAGSEDRERIISQAQIELAKPLRSIIEQDPLEARLKGRSAEAIIHEVLLQAEDKGQSGNVAQYLVGTKLELRFNREIPVYPANKSDRKSRSDKDAKPGDFVIENAVIEVAVGLPDDKHIEQVGEIINDSDAEVWLLTRADRVSVWKTELENAFGGDRKRIVVTSVEAFVGQNITELAEFSTKGKAIQLEALFARYNSRWVQQVGTPGIRIVLK